MTEPTTLGRTDAERYAYAVEMLAAAKKAAENAEGAMAALTHPYRDGDTAKIVTEWGESADAAFDMTLEASGLFDVAIEKLNEARKSFAV